MLLWEGRLCGKVFELPCGFPCFSALVQDLCRGCNNDRVSVVLWKGLGKGYKAGPLYTQVSVSSGLRLSCTNQTGSISPEKKGKCFSNGSGMEIVSSGFGI